MRPLLTFIAVVLTSSIQGAAVDLPKGITIENNTKGGIVIKLAKDTGLTVLTDKNDEIELGVVNSKGILNTIQISDGIPVAIKYLSKDKAEIKITRSSVEGLPFPVIIDEDGDGIPDIKIDRDKDGNIKKFRLSKIEWQEIKQPENKK